jgi:predicted ATPase/DNA-binding winged helix-turn-helix (wHTH) protein
MTTSTPRNPLSRDRSNETGWVHEDHHTAIFSNLVISFGPFRLFLPERLLKKGGETIQIGGRALDLLIALVERAGQVVTRRELISRVWPDVVVDEANLRMHVATLRKILGHGGEGARYIINVPGQGYSFTAPVTHLSRSNEVSPADRLPKLPALLTRMVGREDTIRRVSAQLLMWRFVSIVGPGGMGKTTVAVSVAHTLSEGFSGAVFFVDLAGLADGELVPTAVGSALGFVVQSQDPLRSLLAFIGEKKLLLVLDNCEHVIEVAAALAERVVSEAPQAHVLTTSREALRVEGEHVHLLYALDYPPENVGLKAAEALKYPAVQLFMERAAASGYRSELSDADAPSVARICQRLDGIALAIELAASHAGSYGLRGTDELLNNRFKLLWHGRRTALPRHQTLNAMLDWSYNLLTEKEKIMLSRLSVFVGDFTLQAACSVASEVAAGNESDIDAIASLVAKSMISTTITDGSTHYRLLETTRGYASTKLAARGEADRIVRRHAITYSKLLENDETIQSTFGEHNLSGYATVVGNVRAALVWALANKGDLAVGIELVTWAAPLFIGLSLLEECRRWCERALAALDDANRDSAHEMILQEALALSSMLTVGHSDQVRRAIDRGLVLAKTFQDRARQLRLLAGLNLYLVRFGDFLGAKMVAEQGGAIAHAAKLPGGVVWSEWMVGIAHHLLGDQAAAQLHCERAMALEAEIGPERVNFFGSGHRVGTLLGFARVLWLRGFSDRARDLAQTVMVEATNRGHPVSICISLVYASTIFLWTQDFPRASALIEQLIAYAERHSLHPYRTTGIALKGELAVVREEAEVGIDLLRSALSSLRAERYNVLITRFLCTLAEGLRKIGKFDEALLTIDDVIARVQTSGGGYYLPELLRIKALIVASTPQSDRAVAIAWLDKSLAIAREQSALALELRSATTLARWLAEDGQRDAARDVLSSVYGRFTEGFETADLRIAHQLLKDDAQSLTF